MRIVGGVWRGRSLVAPKGRTVRPTSDRAREAVFNILENGREFEDLEMAGAMVCDLFAGTGAFGLEALSRGAARALFVERDPAARAVLEDNIARLGAADRARVLAVDAIRLPAAAGPCDLVFLDPPYDADLAGPALDALSVGGWLRDGSIAVVERPAKRGFAAPAAFEVADERRYGAARLWFLRYKAGTT